MNSSDSGSKTELTLDYFSADENIFDQLCRAGLSDEAAKKKAAIFVAAAARLAKQGVRADANVAAYFVPGRIEVLGKHTDYAGGRSLLAAVERGFCAIAASREDTTVVIGDAMTGEEASFLLTRDLVPTAGHWSNYSMTVAKRIASNFPGSLQGAQIAWSSDLPMAAGMSSSSAMVTTTFLLLSAINNLPARDEYQAHIQSREDLAAYVGTVENGQSFGRLAGERGVGTFGGSEDHAAMLCSQAGQLVQYSYCPIRKERTVQLPDGFVFAIGSSGVLAEKTGAAQEKYNRVSKLASALVEIWNTSTGRDDPHLAAALASDSVSDIPSNSAAADRLRKAIQTQTHPEFPEEPLLNRLTHFFIESEQIIPKIPEKLTSGNLNVLGELVDLSQESGAKLLGNQVPETVALAQSARKHGAVAASAFGAGFGGSVWALVPKNLADDFLKQWGAAYVAAFPEPASRAEFFTTQAGPPAIKIEASV